MGNKFIVFDRDGTLIKHKPYLFESKELELLPYVFEGLTILKNAGYKLFYIQISQVFLEFILKKKM